MAKNQITIVLNVEGGNALKVVSANADQAAASLNKAGKSAASADHGIKGASEQSSNATKNFSKMAQGISGPVVRAYATLAANLFAIGAAYRYLQKSADYGSMVQAQKNFAANTGIALNSVTKRLTLASKGMLDFAGASKIAGLAVAAGLNPKQLEDYAKSARAVADVLGEDYENTLKRLVKATASGRTTLLREIGVTVDANKAKADYAKTINKTAAELTEFQAKQAIIIETQRQLNSTFADSHAQANPFDILLSKIQDLIAEVTQKVMPLFEGLAKVLDRTLIGLVTILATFSISILKTAIPLDGLKTKFEAWQSAASTAALAARKNIKDLTKDIRDLTEEYKAAQEGNRDLMRDTAQQVAPEIRSPLMNKAAAGSINMGASQTALTAFYKKLEAESGKATSTLVKDGKVVSGAFRGMTVQMVNDYNAAVQSIKALSADMVEIQATRSKTFTSYWIVAFNHIKLAGVWTFNAITAAAQRMASVAFKALRLLSWAGLGMILVEAFNSIRANIYDIATSTIVIFQSILEPMETLADKIGLKMENLIRMRNMIMGHLKGGIVGLALGAAKETDPAVLNAERIIALTEEISAQQMVLSVDMEDTDVKRKINGLIAELEAVKNGASVLEIALIRLAHSGLKEYQERHQAAQRLRDLYRDAGSSIEAANIDLDSFTGSLKTNTSELKKQEIQIAAIATLSLSDVLEKLVSQDDSKNRQDHLEEIQSSLEKLVIVSGNPALKTLMDNFSFEGKTKEQLIEFLEKLRGIEGESHNLNTSFKTFKETVANFSWDSLTSGDFNPLLARLIEVRDAQQNVINQAEAQGTEAIAKHAQEIFMYDTLISQVQALVDSEHAITLEKIKQEKMLAAIGDNQSASFKTLKNYINIEKATSDVASKRNDLDLKKIRLSREESSLRKDQRAALEREVQVLSEQIALEDQKIERMNQQFALQTKIYQLEEKSVFLEKTKEKLDVHKDILEVRKSLLDVERDIALERAKLQGMAVGREGASASDEYKIFKDQQEARRALIYEEAAQKRESLFAEYRLFELKSEKETAEFELRNSMLQGELDAKTELLNRELEERWKLLREEARIKGLETPQGSSNVQAPTLGQDSALQLQNYKAIQDQILAGQQLLLGLKSEEIDLQATLQELQLDTGGLDKQLSVIDEIKNKFSDILGLAKGTKLEGLLEPLLESGAAVFGMYKAQQEAKVQLAQEVADNLIRISEERAAIELKLQLASAARQHSVAQKYSKQIQKLNAETAAQSVRVESAKTKSNIAMAGTMAQGIGGALTALAATQDQTSKSGFESAKKMQMAAAIVNTAGAIMNAMATVQPFPAAIAAAAVAAAVGAAQIAAISKTEFGGGGSAPTVAASGISTSGGTSTIGSGAGGVLGDPTKNSESLSKSEELLDSIHASEIRELRGMHDQIKRLNSNITGLFTAVIRGIEAGDVYSGKLGTIKDPFADPFNKFNKSYDKFLSSGPLGDLGQTLFVTILDPILAFTIKGIGSLASKIFGGKVTQTITAQGLAIGDIAITDLLNGIEVSVQNYATVRTRKSGGWFSSSKTSFADHFEKADSEVVRLFNSLFLGIAETVVDLITDLGGNLQAFLDHSFTFDKINLKDKTTEEIQEILTNISNNFADASIKVALESILTPFQQVGESLFETAIRVNIGRELVTRALALTGTEIFIGMTQEVEVYKRRWFGRSRKSIEQIEVDVLAITENIINLSGGLEKFHENFSSFVDLFYSDAEKFAMNRDNLKGILEDTVSLNLPSTREAWVAQISAIDVFTEAGQKAYATMLEFSEHADAYYSFIEDAQEKQFDLEIGLLNEQGYAYKALSIERQKELASLKEIDDALGSGLVALQTLVYQTEDANNTRTLEIELLDAQGYAYDVLLANRERELKGLSELDQILKLQVWGTEDSNKTRTLEIELIRQQGYAHRALTLNRQEELKALSAVDKAIQKQIWRAEFNNKRFNLTQQILNLSGKEAEALYNAREQELLSMDVRLQGLQRHIWMLQDTAKSEDDLIKARDKASQAIAKLIDDLMGGSLAPVQSAEYFQNKYSTLLGGAIDARGTSEFGDAVDAFTKAVPEILKFASTYGGNYQSLVDTVLLDLRNLEAPGYASGGYHSGGIRWVGEYGPELEYTGPSRIYSNSDSTKIIADAIADALSQSGDSNVSVKVYLGTKEMKDYHVEWHRTDPETHRAVRKEVA